MGLSKKEKEKILEIATKLSDKTDIKKLQKKVKAKLGIVLSEKKAIYYLEKGKELSKEYLKKEEKDLLQFLNKKGLSLKDIKQLLETKIKTKNKKKIKINNGTNEIVFGIVSDTHLGNKLCSIDELKEFYEIAKKEGAEVILHGGDIVDGFNVYKGQIFELKSHSIVEQLREVKKKYPKGIKTYVIGGNHDESWIKLAGADILSMINSVREDIKPLGRYNGRIVLNGFVIDLQHGGGSQAYAKSYKIQKYLENYNKGDDPDVFILGHYHDALYMVYRGIDSFLPGAFLKENNLAKRYKLGNTIGGWLVWIKKEKGKKKTFVKFVDFS